MTSPHLRSLACALALLLTMAGCGSDSTDTQSASKVRLPSSTQDGGKTTALEDPTPVPDLTMTTMEGETIKLAERPGEVLMLNFWATWCPPCRKEIPDLVSLQQELGDKGLTIIGIAMDQEGEKIVQPFLNEHNVNYPTVIDSDASISKNFNQVYGLPTTLVVGPDGHIRYRILGVFPIEEMKPKLMNLLKEGRATARRTE